MLTQIDKPSILLPTNTPVPGAAGLTEEQSLSGDYPEWLFEAHNAVYTKEGTLAPRELFRRINFPSAGVPNIGRENFYPTYAGTKYFVSVNKNIYTQYGSPLFGSAHLGDFGLVAPTLPTTTKHWKAVFLGKGNDEQGTFFFADGELPKYWSGDFYFSQIPTGPTYGIAHAAFGRIWATDGYTLKWSVLMDGKDWAGTGSGSLNLRINLGEKEIVTAIADFNNMLILFTNRSVLLYENPFNIAVDVTGVLQEAKIMELKDKIDGQGCVGQNAWCSVGEELYFVAYNGLFKLSKILSEGGSNPIGVVCPQINRSIMDAVSRYAFSIGVVPFVRLNYHPLYGMMTLETADWYYGVYIIWLTKPLGKNQAAYAVTQWGSIPRDRVLGLDRDRGISNTEIYGLFSGGTTVTGVGRSMIGTIIVKDSIGGFLFANVCSYGSIDKDPQINPVAEPDGFDFRLRSAWLNFGDQAAGPVIKMPKDLKIIYRMPRNPDNTGGTGPGWEGYIPQPLFVKFNLRYDYDTDTTFTQEFIAPLDTAPDYAWSKNMYPPRHHITPVAVKGSGNLVQWEIIAHINNQSHETFSIQKVGIQSKLGRIHQGI